MPKVLIHTQDRGSEVWSDTACTLDAIPARGACITLGERSRWYRVVFALHTIYGFEREVELFAVEVAPDDADLHTYLDASGMPSPGDH